MITTQLAFLVLLVAVPGVGLALALYRPQQLPLGLGCALAIASGYAIVAAVSFVLAVTDQLTAASLYVTLGLVCAGMWVVALRRSSLGDLSEAARAARRNLTWDVWLGIGAVVAIAVARAGLLDQIMSQMQFRYWIDGMQIASAGGFIDQSIDYGSLYPTNNSKAVLDTFNASIHVLTGDTFVAPNLLTWIAVVVTAFGVWISSRQLGLRYTAPLMPLLIVGKVSFLSAEISYDLRGYRAEAFTRAIAFCALAVALWALRKRQLKGTIVAGTILGVVAASHLVPALVVIIVLGWFALGLLLKSPRRDRVASLMGRLAVIGILTLVVWMSFIATAAGELAFGGAQSPQGYEDSIAFDPTLFLLTGAIRPAHAEGDTWYEPPSTITALFLSKSLRIPEERVHAWGRAEWFIPAVAAGGLLLWALTWLSPERRLRIVGLAAVGTAAVFVAISILFSFRYHLYTFGLFGVRRFYDYGAFSVALLGLAVLETILLLLRRIHTLIPAVAATILVALLGMQSLPDLAPPPASKRRARASVRLLNWVRSSTPCGSRLLTNQRSLGALLATTGRVGTLEGMGPFLRPEMLADLLPLLLDARAFYRNPVNNQRFLQEHGVDYVLLVKNAMLGPRVAVGKANEEALRAAKFLDVVADNNAFLALSVKGARPEPGAAAERASPFPCETGRLDPRSDL